jgi:proline dehydrogenase
MEPELAQKAAADALRRIARNLEYKSYVMRTPLLHAVLLKPVLRFIGGETLDECLGAARALNEQGFATSIDHMGESTWEVEAARSVIHEFIRLIRVIAEKKLDSAVSLDLSHIGLAVAPEVAYEHASLLAREAAAAGIEIMLNMEESARTSAILEVHTRLCEKFSNVGVTLQAYLHRTESDLQAALARPGRIRLVKGAYREPPEVALPLGPRVDAAYRNFMELLLRSGHPCWIATHDPVLLEHAHRYIHLNRIPKGPVEFEMNYGVRPDQWAACRDRGYRTSIYLPYGTEWFLYLCHRIAEHPPNLFAAVADAIDALIAAREESLRTTGIRLPSSGEN